MDLQNPNATNKHILNARGSYQREVSPDPMYLNKVRSEFITNPVIQPAESPKKHNFNRTRLSSKKKSVQPSLNVRQILRENTCNSQMSEKYREQSKEATIIEKDTVKDSRNRLQQLMESHHSVTSKNTRSVSKHNSAAQSPMHRGSSQPRMYQMAGDGDNGISPSKPAVVVHGRLTLSGQKTEQRAYASKSNTINDASSNHVFETCEKPKELLVGDSAKMSECNPKLIVDWSDKRDSTSGVKEVNEALINGSGTVTQEDTHPREPVPSSIAEDPSLRVTMRHSISEEPTTLHKQSASSPVRASELVDVVDETIMNESGIDHQASSSQNASIVFCPPTSAKADFLNPLKGQYTMPYRISKDESTKQLRIQRVDNLTRQRYAQPPAATPNHLQGSSKKGHTRSYMGSTASMERKQYNQHPGAISNNFHRPKSNLTSSGAGIIGKPNGQPDLARVRQAANMSQTQLKSACSTYAINAPKTRTGSVNKYMAKIGKNTAAKNDFGKRLNKQSSVDFKSSIMSVQITLDKYHQRKKSAMGASNGMAYAKQFIKGANQSKYNHHLQSSQNLTHRPQSIIVGAPQAQQSPPGSQPTTATNAATQSKKDVAAKLVNRLYNDTDMRKKRKENLRKKVMEQKQKELTMVPKINKKSEVLYQQKVMNKRMLALEGEGVGASSQRNLNSKRPNFFLNKYKQMSPTGHSRNNHSMSPVRKEQQQTAKPENDNNLATNMKQDALQNPSFMHRASGSLLNQTQYLKKDSNYFKSQRNSLTNLNQLYRNHSIREEADQILKEISIEVDRIDKLQEQVKEQQKLFEVVPNSASIFSQGQKDQLTPRNLRNINSTIQETNREATDQYDNQEINIQIKDKKEEKGPQITRFGSQNHGNKPLYTNESDVILDVQLQNEPDISQMESRDKTDSRIDTLDSMALRASESEQKNSKKSKREPSQMQNSKEDFYKYLAMNKNEKIKKLEEEKNFREMQECTFQPMIIESKSSGRFGYHKRSVGDNKGAMDLGNIKNLAAVPQPQNSNSSRYKSTDGHLSVFKKLAAQKSRDYNKYEMEKLQKDLQECSFRPAIDKSSNIFKSIDARSTEQLQKMPNHNKKQKREDLLSKGKNIDEKYQRLSSKHRYNPNVNLYKQVASPGKPLIQSGRLSLRKRSQDAMESRQALNQTLTDRKKKFEMTTRLDRQEEEDKNAPQVNNIILQNQVFQIQTTSIHLLDLPNDATTTPLSQAPGSSLIPIDQSESALPVNHGTPDGKLASNTQTMNNSRVLPYNPQETEVTDDTQAIQPVLVSIQDGEQVRRITPATTPPPEQEQEAQQQSPPPVHHPTPLHPLNDSTTSFPREKEQQQLQPTIMTTTTTVPSHRRKSQHSPRRKRRDRKTSNVLGGGDTSMVLIPTTLEKETNVEEHAQPEQDIVQNVPEMIPEKVTKIN